MSPKLIVVFLLNALLLFPGSMPATAQDTTTKLRITEFDPRQMPIAVTAFMGDAANTNELGEQISQVISADLERSGLFELINPDAFLQTQVSMTTAPRFREWRQTGAESMVQGRIIRVNGGRLRVEFRLWDVLVGKQLIGQAFSTDVDNWRRVAHIVADAIYKRMTGEDGYFDTRIVYISETGPATKRVKKLAIMDQDGANHRYLTDGSNLVLTPRFSPTLQEVTYVSYDRDVARVYIYNIESNKRELLGQFPDMTFAPRFTPDGNGVILSMSREGNADIFTMDLRTRKIRRLTFHDAIDTSPSFSPDGSQIVFNSDRDGSQQLYVMSAQGGDARRISFGQGRYATPVWSPRGDLIAYTKMLGGQFYVGVMRPDGSGERELSGGFLVESPTWAPNGRVLMFFREDRDGGPGNRSKLYTIDLTGHNRRLVQTPTDASDPAWSPLIP